MDGLNKLLFNVRATERVRICESPGGPEVHPNIAVRKAQKSSRRPLSANDIPKISKLSYALESIYTNPISAIATSDGNVYCELKKTDGSIVSALFYQNRYYSSGSTPDGNTQQKLYLITYLLSKLIAEPADYGETLASLKSVTEEYNNNGYVTQETMAYFCDCFYYDSKNHLGDSVIKTSIPVNPVDEPIINLVQQSIRTEAMQSLTFVLPSNSTGINLDDFAGYFDNNFTNVSYTPPATSPSVSPSYTSFLENCKMGKYEIGFEWTPEQQKRIQPPSFLDSFVPNESFMDLVMLADAELNSVIDRINLTNSCDIDVIGSNYINAILVGKPGTGKTTTAEALSAALGLPIYTVKTSKNTEEDTFEGMTKVANGNFTFRSTPFLEGYEHGGIIVLEEFNLADPGVMQGAIGQAIEYPFILMKDGYEEVHRHPLCLILSTMNTATQGAREPNEALTSRSPIALVMEDPDENEFIEILCSKGYDKKDCKNIYKVYDKIIKYLTVNTGSEEMAMQVTLRHCLGALKLMSIGIPLKSAVKKTMVGSIAIKDLTLAKEIYENLVDSIRL